jgi:hypothetical protein
MWMVKGILLGILLFIVGGLSYVGIRVAIALRRVTAVTAVSMLGDGMWGIAPLPTLAIWALAALLGAIAIGLWIMRARTTRTV